MLPRHRQKAEEHSGHLKAKEGIRLRISAFGFLEATTERVLSGAIASQPE